jgi:hypothetical protein
MQRPGQCTAHFCFTYLFTPLWWKSPLTQVGCKGSPFGKNSERYAQIINGIPIKKPQFKMKRGFLVKIFLNLRYILKFQGSTSIVNQYPLEHQGVLRPCIIRLSACIFLNSQG